MLNVGNKCCGCGNCSLVCPKQCITMKPDSKGFLYPEVDSASCIHCGKCEKTCPVLNVRTDREEKTAFFAAINKNKEERMAGSSGGFFPVLAEYILDRGGAVFGAALGESAHHLCHVFVEKKEDLKALRGSKYIQSDLERSFETVERFLKAGRQVLFTGTPCQIAALYSFLGQPYEILVTMDVICHGVASPRMWEKYTEELEAHYKSKMNSASFREKKYGWRAFSMYISFQNGKIYRKFFKQDPFGRAYLSNVMLCPSCYNCSFASVERLSDFTAGDFWGNGELMPDDDTGISLILVHSEKGKRIWTGISKNFEFSELSRERAVNGNTPLYKSAECKLNIEQFYDCVSREGFDKAVDMIIPYHASVKQRLRYIAKKIGL